MTSADSAPTVRAEGGRLRGYTDGGVSAFLGIPYAAPPFGTRRLRPPEPPARWDGERPATSYGPTCPKGDYPPQDDPLFPELVIGGEDCLNLNVWTPDPGGSGLPVLVWIHGGMFRKGSGSEAFYRGTSFARDGVVCVTINYRLAAEGFLYLEDGTANLGLLDQVAALGWVQRNIAAFGGDPARVTVAGQSAGAMSVITLLSMPRARGLFHQAIAQSGAAAATLTAGSAAQTAALVAKSLGVAPARDPLSQVPAERLGRAASAAAGEIETMTEPAKWGGLAFAPVIDGDILPEHPLDALRKGASGGVRLLTGWTRDEVQIGLVPTGMIDMIDEPALSAAVSAMGAPDGTAGLYRAARPGASSGELLAAVATDRVMRIPVTRVAEARLTAGSAGSDGATWLYRFDHESPSFGGRLGAAHAVEIPYVFDRLVDDSSRALIGDAPSQAVADTAHGAWVRFTAVGDPGWPRYSVPVRSTALIDEKITVADDPGGAEREAWAGLS